MQFSMNRQIKSLSTKIVFLLVIFSLLSIFIIFNILEKINKEAFRDVEMEKANLIVSTIEPLIALNIFLGMEERIDQTIHQLMENQDILAVKVFKNDQIINEVKSNKFKDELIYNSFIVQKDLFQPNSQEKIGSLLLIYSNENFEEIMKSYTTLLIEILFALGMFLLLFTLYVKRLLSPLKNIVDILKGYSPESEIKIPFSNQNNEIGLISHALNNMQKNILIYSEKQKNINKYLEEKVAEKTIELRTQLYTNSLTGLPNRLTLLNDINGFKEGALLIINIDDFKEINDFFGQIAGDNILIEFAKKLDVMFKQDANVKLLHLSGDEFALFFTKKPSIQNFIEIAQKLVNDVEKMIFYHEENELSIRVSIGGVFQMEEALEKADIALKSAKKHGKSFLLYDEKLNVEKQYKNNIEWIKKLKSAIENDKIVPYFQPIFDSKTNNIISYECLIRLIDGKNDIISPYAFLTIAKKSKLYTKLTKIMVEKSCCHFENIDSSFSINLSVEDMLNEDTVDFIKYNVQKYKVHNKIIFEILETEGIETYEDILNFINDMKIMGCKIAIDDFGSGYSNFEYLLQLNIDYIKIDGSLIKNIDKDVNAQIIVETVVDFAKKLDMVVVAEYVHNKDVYDKIKELKIDRMQGYYLSEPKKDTY